MTKRTKRPWKAFVRDIGPTFAFATEDRARARAEQLVAGELVINGHLYGNYAEVVVYGELGAGPADQVLFRRTVYRHDREPVEQEFRVRAHGGREWCDVRL